MTRSPLETLLYRELTGGRGSLRQEDQPRTMIKELLQLHGGNVRRAAAFAGIGEQTLRDWIKGRHKPSVKGLGKLRATLPARRRLHLPASREKWLTGKPYIRIHAWTRVPSPGKKGDDRRERKKMEPWPYMPRGSLRATVDLFLAGEDMSRVADAFVAAVAEHYEGVLIESDHVTDLVIRQRPPKR